MSTTVSIKTLLDAGVHFGHQTRRWNPKMKPYILGERNGIYILDLKQTMYALDAAYTFLAELGAAGKKVLFVGTKKQAQEPVREHAERAGQPYVNFRWMGGMLTNFDTIRTRVQRMEEIEGMKVNGTFDAYTKKEQAKLNKELGKLQDALGGIREMHSRPDAVFIVDTTHEEIAVKEAKKLGIPIIGLIDSNADPDGIEFGIPANDDAIRSVKLMCSIMADAVLAGSGADVSLEEMTQGTEADGGQDASSNASTEQGTAAQQDPASDGSPADAAADASDEVAAASDAADAASDAADADNATVNADDDDTDADKKGDA